MKRMLYLSGLSHLIFLSGLIIIQYVWFKPTYYTSRQVYNVNLVTLPSNVVQPKRSRVQTEEPYKVVPKKEAARPDQEAKLALKRTPKLVSEEPEIAPDVPTAFESGTQGVKLDLKEFEFPYYLAIIQRKIQQNLKVPRLPGVKNLKTTIYFKITPSGRIENMKMERGSISPVFDLAAKRALERSDPLPPLPDGFDHEYLGVHFDFEYFQ